MVCCDVRARHLLCSKRLLKHVYIFVCWYVVCLKVRTGIRYFIIN